MFNGKGFLALGMLLFCFEGFANDVKKTHVPAEAFAEEAFSQIKLSPDGTRVLQEVSFANKTVIAVSSLTHPNQAPVSIYSSDNKEFTFRWARWVNNDRILISIMFPSKRSFSNFGFNYDQFTSQDTRLISVRADGSGAFSLVNPKSFRGKYQAAIQDGIIDMMPEDGKHVLLQMSEGDMNPDISVYKYNVEDGSREVVHSSRHTFYNWITDRNHKVRVGLSRLEREEEKFEVHVCDPDGKNWRRAWAFEVFSKQEVWPLGFGKDPNLLYVSAQHEGRDAIFTVDLRDPKLTLNLKFSDPYQDVSGGLIYSQIKGDYVGVTMEGQGSVATNYWDQEYREIKSEINEAFPNRYTFFVSRDASEKNYLLSTSASNIAPEYFLGNIETGKVNLYGKLYPQLDNVAMAKKRTLKISNRHGDELPSFITLPISHQSGTLPMVLLVHGGPQSHDRDNFDPWVQFLAHRGYAVLQVNFRGSNGYGSKHYEAGLRKWGEAMQDDLSDAVRWAIKEKIADPKRIAIVGASYGGYAALMGAAKTPELYRAAFSFAGVSDIVALGLDSRNERVFAKQVGDLDKDRARLRGNSPVNLAENIKIPLLMIHGTKDRSVDYQQAVIMAKALDSAGNKNYRLITQENGDHHLSAYDHRLQFFQELERFLEVNLR